MTDPQRTAICKHNQFAILIFELIWGLAIPFVLATTVLAGYLDSLGAPKELVGAVPALFFGGIAIIQPFSLYLIPPGPKRFPRMLWAYRIGSLGYIMMAFFVLLLPESAIVARITSFFSCYAIYVLVAGAGDPHYISAIMDCIETQNRGVFFAYRLVCCGMGGLLGGEAARRVLKAFPQPVNFGISILIGGSLIVLATIWFGRFKPMEKDEPAVKRALSEYLSDAGRLIRANPAFARFLVTLFIIVALQGCAAFVALSIREKLHIGDSILGRLGSIDALSSMLFALLLGKIGDKINHRSAFILGMLLYIAGLYIVITSNSAIYLQTGYLLVGAAASAWTVSSINMAFDYSTGMEAARVYAAVNVTAVPFKVLGPILAGAAVSRCSYPPVMECAILAALLAIILAATLPKPSIREGIKADL